MTEIATRYADLTEVPKLENGLTPLLKTLLDSQALKRHRATLVIELEKLAKKFDRFGWERDRGSAAHDGMILDWMDALQDYPLEEVREACRRAVLSNPDNMPNEGHVRAEIIKARHAFLATQPKNVSRQTNVRPVASGEFKEKIGAEIAQFVARGRVS